MLEVQADLARALAGGECSAPGLCAAEGRFPLVPGRRFSIGSDPRCEVQLQHPSVAPRHAELRLQSAGWILCDLRSPTGCFVNGVPVPATAQRVEDGDRVRIGHVELTFEDPRARAC